MNNLNLSDKTFKREHSLKKIRQRAMGDRIFFAFGVRIEFIVLSLINPFWFLKNQNGCQVGYQILLFIKINFGWRVRISSRRFQQAHSTASHAQDGIQADGGKFRHTISRFLVDNCIHNITMGYMPFIQFPFIEVPKELLPIVGKPTPSTRAYRREGTFKECGQWFETLAEHYKGDVGLSSGGVIMFVPVSRAGVHKRIKEGKLTAFFFYVTHEETRPFGAKRMAKERPFILVSVSECKAWAEDMKRKVGFVDDPNETPFLESTRLLREGGGDEPASAKEEKEADEFVNQDPKDKGSRKVKYRDYGGNKENLQQDWIYMAKELQAAMASPEKAAAFRRRLRKGMEWDKGNKTWKLKEEK